LSVGARRGERNGLNDQVTAYALDATSGRILVGRLVRLACERHLRDLVEGPARGLHFDAELANDAIDIFRCFRHSKGEWAGQPIVLSPPEAFIIGSIFGWVRTENGLRRFRKAYSEVAKKFGKSTIAAGVGLLMAFFDGEAGAEVYAAATKRDQAKIVFDEARRIVLRSPGLRKRIQVRTVNLHSLETASKFEPLGADADSLDGPNSHCLLVDELHAHKSRAMLDVLELGMGARRQPLVFIITTSGYDRHSVCWDERDYTVKVLEGVLSDDGQFGYIATLDVCEACRAKGKTAPDESCERCDDWTDETVWPKANPNLPITPKLDDMRKLCQEAREKPTAQNAFKRFRLNIWTESITRWLPSDAWAACGGPLRALPSRRGFLGLDLSSTTDLSALVAGFPDDDGTLDVLARFWMPADNVTERVKRDRAPYDVWAREGILTLTEGNIIDYDVIYEAIVGLPEVERVEIIELGYDPWNATGLATRLTAAGITCVPIRQTFAALSAPSKMLEVLVAGRRLRHGGNQLLALCAANAVAEIDASGNIKPSKAKSTGRIDGITALVVMLARQILQRPVGDWTPHDALIGPPRATAEVPW
jgi:phage terminase large subunit-like protein